MKGKAFADVELVRGSGGVFDVHLDDKLVFSKHAEGRFPEKGEVLARLTGGKSKPST